MGDDKKFLLRSIEMAKESVRQGGFPAGAVVVKDGKIIAEGISIGGKLYDPSAHAETSAIREACKKLQTNNLEGAILYESLQSCLMCFSVASWAGISKIVYACRKTPDMVKKFYYEGFHDNEKINLENNKQIESISIPDFEKDSLALINDWEKRFI